MADISKITLPNGDEYNFKDADARTNKANITSVPASASISSAGLITYKNSSGTSLFTLQLPIYNGGVS